MKTLIYAMLFCWVQTFAWGQEGNHLITASEIAPDVYVLGEIQWVVSGHG